MNTAGQSVVANELESKTEERIETLVGDIGRVIRAAEPERRAALKELAETLLHEEVLTIAAAAETTTAESPRGRTNPLAAGILLTLLGFGFALIVPFVGLTLAAIGLILVVWGGAMSWLKR
jgi:hypothetical protein